MEQGPEMLGVSWTFLVGSYWNDVSFQYWKEFYPVDSEKRKAMYFDFM